MARELRIQLSDEDYARLARLAERRHQPPEHVSAELLCLAVTRATAGVAGDGPARGDDGLPVRLEDDPFWQVAGIITTGCPGWADRHDEILGDALLEELRGGRVDES